MSFSNPTLENPCKKFIDFKSDDKQFVYWDKEKGEKGEQVVIPAPIYFIVLDELTTITGYYKEGDCGIYSNEVHRTTEEILKVRTFKKGGPIITGLYDAIKASIKEIGGKYTRSIYAMLINPDGTTELVNFRFKGAAFSAWLDAEKHINTSSRVVCITGDFTEGKNGKTVYNIPVFKAFAMKDEYRKAAIEMDGLLQSYLKDYKSRQAEKETAREESTEAPVSQPISQMPMSAAPKRDGKFDAVPSDVRELELASDLPFDIEPREPKF